MSWMKIGNPRPEWTGAAQRVRNATEGARKVVEEYKHGQKDLTGHLMYAEVCAALPRLVEITEQLARDIEMVDKEHNEEFRTLSRLLKQEERTAYAETLEERTAQLHTRQLNYNMCIVGLNYWESGEDLPAAKRYIQQAYFNLFPEHRPQPGQATGAYTLTCRHLTSDIRSSDFTHHPTREAAIEYAQKLAQARQATLEAWDTYIHPDGKEVIRTSDDQDMSYRIAPNRYRDAMTELN